MPVCIFNMLARSSCQPLLSQLLQQTTSLHRLLLPQLLPLLPPSATAPPNAHLNPQLPIRRHCPSQSCRCPAVLCAAAATTHRNCATGWPLPSLSPIAIVLPATPACCCTHAATSACCRMHAAAAACCCTHAASAARCRTHAGCLPSIAIVPPAAAACCRTHARCSLPHTHRRCCLLLHAHRFHHCSHHHCHLRCCWCHVH